MLSSRYLHLHEALGLGPMWLNRKARVRPSEHAAAAYPAPGQPQAEESVPQAVRSLSPAAHQARLAATALAEKGAAEPSQHPPQETARLRARPAATPNPPKASAAAPEPGLSDGLPPLEIAVRPSEIMVVSICPSADDSMLNELFSGNTGVLLDNMLAAIGLTPTQAHKTCWVKSAPISGNPGAAQIEAAAADMAAELVQSRAKAVLFLGQIFEKPEQTILMGQLCGTLPCFVIPHPARLLRQPLLKAQAWTELKKLKRALRSQ